MAPARVINVGAETTNLSNFTSTLDTTVELEFGGNVWYGPKVKTTSALDSAGYHSLTITNPGTADQPVLSSPGIASTGLQATFSIVSPRVTSKLHFLGDDIDFTIDFTDPPPGLVPYLPGSSGLSTGMDLMHQVEIYFSTNKVIGILNSTGREERDIYPLVRFGLSHGYAGLGGLRSGYNPIQVREESSNMGGSSSVSFTWRGSWL